MPIHETDGSENRWELEEWKYVEYWEEVAKRERRKRRLWIAATVVVCFAISAIPVVRNLTPKLNALETSRKLAVILNRLKTSSAQEIRAYRIRFVNAETFEYVLEKATHCNQTDWQEVVRETIQTDEVRLLLPSEGESLGVKGLIQEFCYDPVKGSTLVKERGGVVGFGIIPVKDLDEQRKDRLALTLISGEEAEISFN